MRFTNPPRAAVTAFFLALCLAARPTAARAAAENGDTATPRTSAAARNFTLEHRDGHARLTVRNAGAGTPGTSGQTHLLVPRGKPVPQNPSGHPVIRTPVRKVVVMETVHIGYLDALDALQAITGAATTDYITNPTVRDGLADGAITALKAGQAVDVERLLLLQPDLVLTSVSGNANFDAPAKLKRTGLPILVTAAHKEAHPLARMEWIRCYGALVDREAEAREWVRRTAERYRALRRRADGATPAPTVFCGAPYSGTWHMPGGASYTAQLIADAGGRYLWADNDAAGSLPLDLERVFYRAADARFWLNPGAYRSLDALYAADPRFRRFRAAREGNVYNNTRQVPKGATGNPVWERGVVRPDAMLADLLKILHPERAADHEFVFYETIE